MARNWSAPSPDLIARHRKLKGLTLKEAAEKANTYPANISDWEKGKRKPTARSLSKLAKAYGCDVDDFYEVDIPTIKTLATAVVTDYFNDPEYNKDRKASIAAHLITALPDAEVVETDEDETQSIDEVLFPEKS